MINLRTAIVVLLALGLSSVSAVALPSLVDGRGIDGVTALIVPVGPNANDAVLTRDPDGSIPVSVTIFRDGANGWEQIRMGVTLRAFVLHADGTESDRVSINFRSSADTPNLVRIPASALATGDIVDIFITFSDLGGVSVPTSHHSPQKNALIGQGEFALAEQFDFHHLANVIVA